MNFGENWKFNPHFGRGRSEQVQQKGKSTGKKTGGFCRGFFMRRRGSTVHGFSRRIREEKGKKYELGFWRILGEITQEREISDCSQDCLGTLLVTLGILTYMRFLLLVISEYSIFCWLVWTKRTTNYCVEISSLSVCYVLHSVNAIDSIWK